MLEEAYGKVTVKKMQVYRWHKHFHADVKDDQFWGNCQIQQMMKAGCTVNKEIYVEIPCHLRDAVKRKRPKKWAWNLVSSAW
jgi:hypothetical protein